MAGETGVVLLMDYGRIRLHSSFLFFCALRRGNVAARNDFWYNRMN